MFRRFAPICVIVLVVSLALVACGDPTATTIPAATTTTAAPTTAAKTVAATTAATAAGNIPTYIGGTSVTLPASLQPVADSLKTSVKESSVTAYKTADAPDKVKSGFADSFKKDGWEDKTSTMGADTKSLEATGAFILFYQKGTSNAAAVVGFPGQIAAAMGVTDVAATGTLYIVISGKA